MTLSQPVAALKARYDAIVVGSGYGGGIAASRLARMGLDVAVLERGPERNPGDFPDSLIAATQELQAHFAGRTIGPPSGLFEVHVNDDIHVLVGCGLGGTSLINGNVMLKPDPRIFETDDWPAELSGGRNSRLEEGYVRARHMLQPVPYPDKVPLNKLKAMEAAARHLGTTASRPPITVTFEDRPGGNLARVVQPACTLCGDCATGCNVGAKNTTLQNYIPDAALHGAAIFCGARVDHLEKLSGGWRVHLEGGQTAEADMVVLGAGTLGSTGILLRSARAGLSASPRLGHGFSGNGDVISFAYNNDVPIDGIGIGHPLREGAGPVGPCIAGLIDLRDTDLAESGMVIQEGAIPSALAAILPLMMKSSGTLFGEDTDDGFFDYWQEAGRSMKSLVGGAYRGAVNHTQTLLVMSHDGAGGQIVIDGEGRPRVIWPDVGDLVVYERVSETLRKVTEATGGTYVANPVWSKLLGRNLVTVHPLGGCGLGNRASDGVVDHKCRVFSGFESDVVHDGLYVCDGAAMPRSLGVNPSYTISAVAERAMMHLADDYGLAFDDAAKRDAPLRSAVL